MKFIYNALALLALVPSGIAAEAASAYTGQEGRAIKALAPDEIESLLAGKGLGYAKSAELNGYPGPAHVLDLAAELQLTEAQVQSTRAIHGRMEERAKVLGERLVSAEAALEELFQTGGANEINLETALARIAGIQAELRGVHLLAHIEQRRLLSSEQVARYPQLRGYHGGQHGASGRHH
ncbi:hypothetical protein H0E84_07590 [Luteimonas sp. SJ-92]|uniref:Periplasmic heavy metal sensor n=1 Tax=Luteimonas salinisoli TaxID=2752307 RepID=A0A853JAJ0_9GAMM|nr:hypothetical protein [Luteimonas salinisoli]NZA26246.1 hypothetical protein [Luteimonas salinisoli]